MPSESDTPTELGPAVRALAAGQVVFGRYELRHQLGEGGFGAVWLVHDRRLREEVALKFVLQAVAASPEAIDSLMAEAARSRRLTHPNIVRIHDFVSDAVGDEPPKLAGISMEYVEGESLAQRRLREPGKCFDVEQIAPWIDQLCHAFTYAHAPKRQVIHRDLKPANLLLAADGELKVADFGIACSLINSVTQISGRLGAGTPPFMSPQQVGGDWPSESDDVYSLGATIHALLTGKPPFHQGDIVHQVMNKVPPLMTEHRERLGITARASIPPAWEETVAACLAKDAAARPASAEAVVQRLGLRPGFAPQGPAPRPEIIRVTGPAAATKDAPFENSLGMRFVPVPGASVLFCVWATRVQDYAVFAKETKRAWPKPDFEQGPTHPAVNVSWEDAVAFCAWLSKKEGRTYRLPTDAEWSTAVGLGKENGSTPEEKNNKAPGYPWGPAFPPPKGFGNYGWWTAPVGSFAPNPFGLYDLSGNVWEWCEDWFDEKRAHRVLRGGSWGDGAVGLRSSCRFLDLPANRYDNYGIRCVLSVSGG